MCRKSIYLDHMQESKYSANDFPEVRKIVEAGATKKSVIDYELSRYACYLIVQNGDIKQWNQLLAETAHDAGGFAYARKKYTTD